jgi:copper chaperone CopZ
MVTQLTVTGMTCGMCVGHLTTALQSVDGVHSAKVDLASHLARVEHNATVEALVEAVEDAGYEVAMATTPAATTTEYHFDCPLDQQFLSFYNMLRLTTNADTAQINRRNRL